MAAFYIYDIFTVGQVLLSLLTTSSGSSNLCALLFLWPLVSGFFFPIVDDIIIKYSKYALWLGSKYSSFFTFKTFKHFHGLRLHLCLVGLFLLKLSHAFGDEFSAMDYFGLVPTISTLWGGLSENKIC